MSRFTHNVSTCKSYTKGFNKVG